MMKTNKKIADKFKRLRKEVNQHHIEFVKQVEVDPSIMKMVKVGNDIFLSDSAKRVRAIIPLLVAEEAGIDSDVVKPYSVIIELLHFISLVHDDVIDKEDERRGTPTLNSRYTNAQAILLGDHFICQCIEYALKTAYHSEVIGACMKAVRNLISGIILEQKLALENMGYDVYENMVDLKTGSLFGLSFGLPFVGTDKFEAATALGRKFGVLFQIYDDYSDREEDIGYYNVCNIFSDGEVQKQCFRVYDEIKAECDRLDIRPVLDQVVAYLQGYGYFTDLAVSEAAQSIE